MKIKRFDNLWLMGLILSGGILGVVYILKFFFPEFVIEVAQIDSIVDIGHYIDTHKWAWYLASVIISFVSSYFYCCACCGKYKLTIKETIIAFSSCIALLIIKELLPNQYTVLNLINMVLLPLIFNGSFKYTVICFSSLNLLQTITLEIRNLMTMVADYNFATLTILTIDYYILAVLLYLTFNYKKEIK